MAQVKHIQSETVQNSEVVGDLSLLFKIARRLAIRTGDPQLISCTELALHLLDQKRSPGKAH
jgi:hypothetical protein